MKAHLSNFRQSPRKVRLVANLIRGKEVARAQRILAFTDNKSAGAMKKLIDSAVSNAKNAGVNTADLAVSSIMIGEGMKLRRMGTRSRGRGKPMVKKYSHISVELGPLKVKARAPRPVKTTTK